MEELIRVRPESRLLARAEELHRRYGRVFWTLHSIWALLTGVVVLVLAHNRYGYLPWVVGFLGLTWASTLFFSRLVRVSESRAFRFAQGFVSYLTRIMYQETLFFLIPFYAYSTTFPSWNSLYLAIMGALAVFSCYDLLFDRWLRERRAFALGFFATVTFSALNFLIPVLLHVRVHQGAYLAGALAFLAAVPLAYGWREIWRPRRFLQLTLAFLLVLTLVRVIRPVVPPVPLRLRSLRLTTELDRTTLRIDEELTGTVAASALASGRLYAVALVFAPADMPAAVTMRFQRDGVTVRRSRTVEVTAHPRGFRVWDALRSDGGRFEPGLYTVELWTREGQLIGRTRLDVV